MACGSWRADAVRVITYSVLTRGQVTASISPTGARTDYEYDDLGRQVTTIAPAMEIVDPADDYSTITVRPRSETVYEALGRRYQTITHILVHENETVDDSSEWVTTHNYDAQAG